MNIGILSGHLTADATFTPGSDQSKTRAKFKLAVPDSYDRNLVSFYTCVAFGSKANFIGTGLQMGNFLKGCAVYVEGRINTKKFTDQNGVEHSYQEVTINEVEVIYAHKNCSEGQNQQNVPNSGNNQIPQSYTGSTAPAGRPQGGPDNYSYDAPQGSTQSQHPYNGQAAPAGRPQGGQEYYGAPQGNGQNQRFNAPQRVQNNQGQRPYNDQAAPAGRPQGGQEYYDTPQINGQNQRFNEPQRSQGSPSRDFSRTGEPAPLPDALPPAPDFASGNGQGSNADGGGFHPAKFGNY